MADTPTGQAPYAITHGGMVDCRYVRSRAAELTRPPPKIHDPPNIEYATANLQIQPQTDHIKLLDTQYIVPYSHIRESF